MPLLDVLLRAEGRRLLPPRDGGPIRRLVPVSVLGEKADARDVLPEPLVQGRRCRPDTMHTMALSGSAANRRMHSRSSRLGGWS